MRRWLLLVVPFAILPSLSRADEACRRNPEPVCLVDWAAAEASPEAAQGHLRLALLVRLRLGRLDDAPQLVSKLRARVEENHFLLELQARTGARDAALAGIRRLRERYEPFLGRSNSAMHLNLPDYLPFIDALRRSGAPADALETARRAAGFLQAWQASADGIPLEAAKLHAEIGAAQLRAGDRDAARASLAAAEGLAPLADDDPRKTVDGFIDKFAAFRATVRLGVALGDAAAVRARLNALAARAAAAGLTAKVAEAREFYYILAKTAALQGYAGDRDAGVKTATAAKDVARKLAGEGVAQADLAPTLFDAHLALGDWPSARTEIARETQDRIKAYLIELLVEAQAEQGQLKEAVETALAAAPANRAHLLRQAALAATAER